MPVLAGALAILILLMSLMAVIDAGISGIAVAAIQLAIVFFLVSGVLWLADRYLSWRERSKGA